MLAVGGNIGQQSFPQTVYGDGFLVLRSDDR